MKKICSIILSLVLISLGTNIVYADTLTTDTPLTIENVTSMLEKYNIEPESIEYINKEDAIASDIHSLKDLENAIVEAENLPDITNETKDVLIPEKGIIKARSTGIANLNLRTEITAGLTVRYAITGNYVASGSSKYWTNCTAASVTEISSNGFKTLGNVRRSSGSVSSDGSKIVHSYDYDIDHYVTVPIPGLDDYVRVKLGSQSVNGTTNFYASSI